MGTDAVHGGDDGKRNTSGDQSIFDCRSAGLVSPELSEPMRSCAGRCAPTYEPPVNIDRENRRSPAIYSLTICESASDENPPDGGHRAGYRM
jgi:hypothetical protein